MNKTTAMHKALEQAFWTTYPTLEDGQEYTFTELFPSLGSSEYENVFWVMVDSNQLPLIPVIPTQNSSVTRFSLDYL